MVKFIISVFVTASLNVTGTPLRAEVPHAWVGTRLLVSEGVMPSRFLLIDEQGKVVRTLPTRFDHLGIPGSGGFDRGALGESFFVNRILREGGAPQPRRYVALCTLGSSPEAEWALAGRYEDPSLGAQRVTLLPTRSGKAVALIGPRFTQGRVPPGCKLPDPGLYTLSQDAQGLFTLGFHTEPEGPLGHGKDDLAAATLMGAGEWFVLLNRETGVYWILDQQEGKLRRWGRILEACTDELIRQGKVAQVVLRASPEASGTVLVAVRRPEAILNGQPPLRRVQKAPVGKPQPILSEDEGHLMAQMAARDHKAGLEREPFMLWYRLDPSTGKATRLVPPPEGATELVDPEVGRSWRCLPDGRVRMGNHPIKAAPDSKEKKPLLSR